MDYNDILRRIDKVIKNKSTQLTLRDKGISEIPPEIGQATSLEKLILDENNLSTLPKEIGELVNLRILSANRNRIDRIPPELTNLSSLQLLHLSHNQLEHLPESIYGLKELIDLRVSDNKLTKLPSSFSRLDKLLRFYASNNLMTGLDKPFDTPKSLTHLDLSKNLLECLPENLNELIFLEFLKAESNSITKIPDIQNFNAAKEINLNSNQIQDLPELETLPIKLERLMLGNNRLLALSPSFLGPSLNLLHVQDNVISELPGELSHLHELTDLNVEGNPLVKPPPEVIRQGREAILGYLKDQLEKSRPQWSSKLLLVGEGGVGKTSLVKQLLEEDFDEREGQTHGIRVRDISFKHPKLNEITMSLKSWDFGGQHIYHATHQFFLTNRSLFLLLWNSRLGFEQGKIDYWLDTIKARAPQSPILIVATHIDEHPARIPYQELKAKYTQIVGHWEISNLSGVGIRKLGLAIAEIASGLPLMGETWPSSWFLAAETVRERPEKYMPPQRLFSLMEEHGVTSDNATVLAQWLHDLGDILFFNEEDDLNDTVILDPQWVTECISRVLDSEEVIKEQGILTKHHMQDLWFDVPGHLQEHFLRLMEQFDLSYRILDLKQAISPNRCRNPLTKPRHE